MIIYHHLRLIAIMLIAAIVFAVPQSVLQQKIFAQAADNSPITIIESPSGLVVEWSLSGNIDEGTLAIDALMEEGWDNELLDVLLPASTFPAYATDQETPSDAIIAFVDIAEKTPWPFPIEEKETPDYGKPRR